MITDLSMASNSSFEFLDNDVSIPYHSGLVMGHTVDLTRQLSKGRKIVADGQHIVSSKINQTTCKFSLATSLNDVCEVLDIPHEYALKVEAGLLQNSAVEACLHDIYKNDAFKLILSLRFIEERQCFFKPLSIIESDSCSTHLVKALCTGDELVIILQITAPECDTLQKFCNKIEKKLGTRSGFLDVDVLTNLQNMATSLDKNLSESWYRNVSCSIKYCTFNELDTYPADVSGMVKVMEEFINKWKDTTDAKINSQTSTMTVRTESNKESADSTTIIHTVVTSKELFNIRVTLTPKLDEEKATPRNDPKHASAFYETILSCLFAVKKSEASITGFLMNHNLFGNRKYRLEGEEISKLVSEKKTEVIDFIGSLDIAHPISENAVQVQSMVDLPDKVDHFVEKVTTQLPPGRDLNLLIVGRTGHGKSATANTILGRKEFATSSGGISEMKSCQKGSADIDGRVFQVFDIPCINYTDLDSVKFAMAFCEEITKLCCEGFHALLLVIPYGIRMTKEEMHAIYMLKCILGLGFVHSHCICVVTHGDNFKESDGKFEDWCKRQEGFLKEFFEECNYRCVLFNNYTLDPTVIKTQIIELVSKVDGLEENLRCYTNKVFQYAERDRQRLIEELELPKFKEDILRDLSLLQGEFENIENADENERKLMLQSLKTKAEDLKGKLDGVKNKNVADLFQPVLKFSENLSRMEEKELKTEIESKMAKLTELEMMCHECANTITKEEMGKIKLEIGEKVRRKIESFCRIL